MIKKDPIHVHGVASWDASGTFRGMESDEDNINKIKQNK